MKRFIKKGNDVIQDAKNKGVEGEWAYAEKCDVTISRDKKYAKVISWESCDDGRANEIGWQEIEDLKRRNP